MLSQLPPLTNLAGESDYRDAR